MVKIKRNLLLVSISFLLIACSVNHLEQKMDTKDDFAHYVYSSCSHIEILRHIHSMKKNPDPDLIRATCQPYEDIYRQVIEGRYGGPSEASERALQVVLESIREGYVQTLKME